MKNTQNEQMTLMIILAFGIGSGILATLTAVSLIRNMALGDAIPPGAWVALGMAAGSCVLLVIASILMVSNMNHLPTPQEDNS